MLQREHIIHVVRTYTTSTCISRIEKKIMIKLYNYLFPGHSMDQNIFPKWREQLYLFFCPRPTAEGNGTHYTLRCSCTKYSSWSFDCSGKIRLLLVFFYQIKCSYLNITESFHTIIPSDHCKYTHLEACPRYLCSNEILWNFLYFWMNMWYM